ncbi:MAG: HAD-IA family hydrolase, partial [Candidatus Omnitrophica bacterium]|nr:HAD-IA family hydrolase [Candidatus Omnitrophota bacterium]
RRAVGWGDENLLKPFIKSKDLSKALKIYRRHHRLSLLKKAYLFGGVKNLLKDLKKKNFKIAIASNRPTVFTKLIIKNLNIKEYIDYVSCADKLKYIKPHPQILYKIMKKFSLKPDEVLYVGDMVIDVEAGRRANIKTVALTTGSDTKEKLVLKKPFRIISKIIQLKDILRELT